MDKSPLISRAKELIQNTHGLSLSMEERQRKAIKLAGWILEESLNNQTHRERELHRQLSLMLADPKGKAFTTSFADRCFRSKDPERIVEEVVYLLDKYGIPDYLPLLRKMQLQIFKLFGKSAPSLFTPIIRKVLRQETANVIIPGEENPLLRHLQKRKDENISINLNHLGEAVLGEQEAANRLKIYLEDLKKSEINYISIKISTLCSQISLLDPDRTLAVLKERLSQLYQAAIDNGETRPKFVNLDMEEYRDLALTVRLFRETLDQPAFKELSAGIVLQAYLPDAFKVQRELTEWAKKRVKSGGAQIKIRLVKGANLAMEQVESSLNEWPQAPYKSKREVDANFKRMLLYAAEKENAAAVRIGVGSHNLFDIAFALLLRAENGVEEQIGFEMLEGMAEPMQRVVHLLSDGMLLYCPVAKEEEFQDAIAYLIRRLDENSASQNFLRHAFSLEVGSPEWDEQVDRFNEACKSIERISCAPRRILNRSQTPSKDNPNSPFENVPNTDWALEHNLQWIHRIVDNWKDRVIDDLPLVIAGETLYRTESLSSFYSPSEPTKKLFNYPLATEEELERALTSAKESEEHWKFTAPGERSRLLYEAAHILRERREEFMGAMLVSGGKIAQEADVEFNEAIDFIEYYRRNLIEIHHLEDIEWRSKGTVLVAPPWNFPSSIPTGGVAAALATGNCVIFKPAREALLIGWLIVNAFWDAGIPKTVLQFMICEDEKIGTMLIEDERINSVILTGATATGQFMLKRRPGLDLIAETGGKNSIIVTKMSDRDLAAKTIIQSAFGHSGQKCSACSLAILVKEVYEDEKFLKQLKDAAESLPVGSSLDLFTKVNPLIHTPGEKLKRALTTLDEGESWLLEPKEDPDNPHLWSPGIKLGVKEGSKSHQIEFFGPVLGVMQAENLDEAIRLANGTSYGLTSGIHSLDEREQKKWIDEIVAGNCYINRTITGAVVQRQPFGGTKGSSFGRGAKAGGPNYLMQLMHPKTTSLPVLQETINDQVAKLEKWAALYANLDDEEKSKLHKSVGNYSYFWKHYFSRWHDPSKLIGQDNFLIYRPERVNLYLQEKDRWVDRLCVIAAALTCGGNFTLIAKSQILEVFQEYAELCPGCILLPLEKGSLSELLMGEIHPRIRFVSEPSELILEECAKLPARVLREPVLANGRIELLNHLREIALSIDYHRYGNLGEREGENRSPLKEPEGKKGCEKCTSCG